MTGIQEATNFAIRKKAGPALGLLARLYGLGGIALKPVSLSRGGGLEVTDSHQIPVHRGVGPCAIRTVITGGRQSVHGLTDSGWRDSRKGQVVVLVGPPVQLLLLGFLSRRRFLRQDGPAISGNRLGQGVLLSLGNPTAVFPQLSQPFYTPFLGGRAGAEYLGRVWKTLQPDAGLIGGFSFRGFLFANTIAGRILLGHFTLRYRVTRSEASVLLAYLRGLVIRAELPQYVLTSVTEWAMGNRKISRPLPYRRLSY